MLRPSPNHGTQRLPNDDESSSSSTLSNYLYANVWFMLVTSESTACVEFLEQNKIDCLRFLNVFDSFVRLGSNNVMDPYKESDKTRQKSRFLPELANRSMQLQDSKSFQ